MFAFRTRFARELEQELERIGTWQTTRIGSVTGGLRQTWFDVKRALGGGDQTILDAVEAGEPLTLAPVRVVVHSWDATHPLNEVADVVLPSTIHAEKEGTFTNLQGRVQEIHAAYPPKGQTLPDLEIFRRLADALTGEKALAHA